LDVLLVEDSHINQLAIEKQLNDKERVSAAFEIESIWQGILNMIL
jgi:hypothetical protein